MIAIKKNPLVLAFRRFMFLRGTTLAAASSFYFMLTIVPMVLLVVRAIGFIFGDLAGALEHVFLVVQNFFPGLTGGFLTTVRELVETALFGSVKITLFNLFVLLVGSLSFVNSLWTGVYLITEDRSFLSWRNYVRAIVLLGFSSIFVTLLFLIPSFFVSLINFLQTNQTLVSIFEVIQLPREYFLELAIIDIDKNFLLKSDFLALTLFIIYFTFTFRFVFKSRLKWRDALLSASGFSLGLLLMKRTFWLYLEASRHSLMSSYGKAYTLVLGTLWIYLGMCLFFLMVSLACELSSRRRALDAQTSKGYHGGTFEGEQN